MEVHMKIIINPQLRKLRTYLNQKHIKYQDFMLNKTILKFSFSQQTYLISCLQNLDITKEQFSFLSDDSAVQYCLFPIFQSVLRHFLFL